LPTVRLTQLGIEKLAPPASGRVVYWDRHLPGFGLRVTESGARSWIAKYRVGDRAVMETLGPVARIPKVDDARRLARESMAKAATGEHPVVERKARERKAAVSTFQAVAERYVERHAKKNTRPKTWRELERLLARDLLPRWGGRPYALTLDFVRAAMRRWERPLHTLRAELGLSRSRRAILMDGQFSPRGTLALFDPALVAPQPDWPARTFVCGAALHDAPDPQDATAPADEALERFLAEGPPPVVFALGSSAVWLARDYWKHAIAACQTLGIRGLLLTGVPLEQSLPPSVAAFNYLPYSRVFPRAAAIVHQAGIGTLSFALRSGRPQLLAPAGYDQPDNAARAARLGVGRVLPFRRAHNAARLVRELRALLGDNAHARAAAETAGRLRSVDGAAAAAQRIIESMG